MRFVGRSAYDPSLHKFTLHHFWQETKWCLLIALFLAVLSILGTLSFEWYAKLLVDAACGDENARQRGDHQRAIQSYSRAITCNDSFAMAYHHRGLAAIMLGQVEQAGKDFQRAHELDKSFPPLTQ